MLIIEEEHFVVGDACVIAYAREVRDVLLSARKPDDAGMSTVLTKRLVMPALAHTFCFKNSIFNC